MAVANITAEALQPAPTFTETIRNVRAWGEKQAAIGTYYYVNNPYIRFAVNTAAKTAELYLLQNATPETFARITHDLTAPLQELAGNVTNLLHLGGPGHLHHTGTLFDGGGPEATPEPASLIKCTDGSTFSRDNVMPTGSTVSEEVVKQHQATHPGQTINWNNFPTFKTAYATVNPQHTDVNSVEGEHPYTLPGQETCNLFNANVTGQEPSVTIITNTPGAGEAGVITSSSTPEVTPTVTGALPLNPEKTSPSLWDRIPLGVKCIGGLAVGLGALVGGLIGFHRLSDKMSGYTSNKP